MRCGAGTDLPTLVECFSRWQLCYCYILVWLQGLPHAVFTPRNFLSITLDTMKDPKITVRYSSTPQGRSKQQCNRGSFSPLRTSWPLQASDWMIQTFGVSYIWIWVDICVDTFRELQHYWCWFVVKIGFYYLVFETVASQQDSFLWLLRFPWQLTTRLSSSE